MFYCMPDWISSQQRIKKIIHVNSMFRNSIKLQAWKLQKSNQENYSFLKFEYKILYAHAWIKLLNVSNLSRIVIAFIQNKRANILFESQMNNSKSQQHESLIVE